MEQEIERGLGVVQGVEQGAAHEARKGRHSSSRAASRQVISNHPATDRTSPVGQAEALSDVQLDFKSKADLTAWLKELARHAGEPR